MIAECLRTDCYVLGDNKKVCRLESLVLLAARSVMHMMKDGHLFLPPEQLSDLQETVI